MREILSESKIIRESDKRVRQISIKKLERFQKVLILTHGSLVLKEREIERIFSEVYFNKNEARDIIACYFGLKISIKICNIYKLPSF